MTEKTAMQNEHGLRSLMTQKTAYLLVVMFHFLSEIFYPFASAGVRNLLLQPLWIYRDGAFIVDFAIIVSLSLYQAGWHGIGLPWWFPKLHEIPDTRIVEAQMFGFLVLLMGFAGLIAWRGEDVKRSIDEEKSEKEEFLIPPLLIPGRTNHSRMFPKKHSFSYSYFSVGIPVGFKGRIGSAISANLDCLEKGERRRGWFHVDASDYLYRGGSERGLEERLRRYLRGEGVEDDAWSFAYLVTAPKFLGYSFNPVSFWYIYDNSDRLSMMVLEVNNTFGERRIYLLKSQGHADDDFLPDGFEAPTKAIKFTNAWVKDFHVSPFNSRKGTYSLTATDPLSSIQPNPNPKSKFLDNTIVLNSSKAHAKLVARVFSEGSPKNPATISTFELAKILASWFWVGFLTFPRIVTQAYILYFKRNLHVWFRPEVLATSLGRTHTSTEKTLEAFFLSYLTCLVSNAIEPLQLLYIPPGSLGEPTTLTSKTTTPETETKEITLKISSPAFYTRFVHYAHTSEAFDREGLSAEPKNRTLNMTHPENLPLLLPPSKPPKTLSVTSHLGPIDHLRWSLLTKLRCRPPAYAYPEVEEGKNATHTVEDIRSLPPSALDRFMVTRSRNEAMVYRRTVTKVFICQRYFFGFEELGTLLDVLFRILLVVVWYNLDRGSERTLRGGETMGVYVRRAGMWVLANGVHFWALAKGVRSCESFG